MIPPGTVLPPAVAKWQFVEEKARAVLDAFAFRQVRLAPGIDPGLAALQAAYAAHAPSRRDPVVRWYGVGATSVPGEPPRHQLTALVTGDPTPAADAELCLLALTLLREADLAPGGLRLSLASEPVAHLLTGLGESVTGLPGADFAFHVTFTTPAIATPLPLASGGRAGATATTLLVDLDGVVQALHDADAGYEPAISILVAPIGAGAEAPALALAQRLRGSGIRTEIEHRPLGEPAFLARAQALGARLMLEVASPGSPAAIRLVDVEDGRTELLPADDVERRVAQLLD